MEGAFKLERLIGQAVVAALTETGDTIVKTEPSMGRRRNLAVGSEHHW